MTKRQKILFEFEEVIGVGVFNVSYLFTMCLKVVLTGKNIGVFLLDKSISYKSMKSHYFQLLPREIRAFETPAVRLINQLLLTDIA